MNPDKSYQKKIEWALATAVGFNNSVNVAHHEKYVEEIQDIRSKILEDNLSVEECVSLWTNLQERARNAILEDVGRENTGPRLSEPAVSLKELARAIRYLLSSRGNSITAELIHQFGNARDQGQTARLLLILLSEGGDPQSENFFAELNPSDYLAVLQSDREWGMKLVEASNRKQKRVEDQIPYEEEIDIHQEAESIIERIKCEFYNNLRASKKETGSDAH